MFDYNQFFGSPLELTILIVAIAGAGALLLVRMPGGGSKEKVVLLEREVASTEQAGGKSKLSIERIKVRKTNQNPEIKPGGVSLTVDEETMRFADTLTVSKKFTLPKGVYKLLGKEGGNLVTFAKSLADTSDLMIDNAGMTRIINRRSLIALAKGAGGAISENILYIVLALMAGVSVGWVIYPYFNHVAPIIETCTRLTNGTVIPRGICPG